MAVGAGGMVFVAVGCGDAVGMKVAVRVGIWVAVETKV